MMVGDVVCISSCDICLALCGTILHTLHTKSPVLYHAGAGWYLEKVIVKEDDQPGSRMFYFPCDRWLDEGQDDGLIERELQAGEPPKQSSESLVDLMKASLM